MAPRFDLIGLVASDMAASPAFDRRLDVDLFAPVPAAP